MYDQIFISPPTVPNLLDAQRSFAVTPKFHLNNRQDKRAFRKDAIRASEFLQWVIDDFIYELFIAPDQESYRKIYTRYLAIWNKTIQHLKTVKPKLKDVNIDAGFFARNYAPKV